MHTSFRGFLACGVLFGCAVAHAAADDAATAARRVDALLHQELFASLPADGPQLAPLADDQTFLRRINLDLVGTLPTPEETIAFSLDPSPDKRVAMVDKLLANSHYGQNWARYWRDVVYYRRAQDRALLGAGATEDFLTRQLNDNVPWDAIARAFVEATGGVQENGATGLLLSQMGMGEEIAAEVSRIFMGVQIQCAQCHDHPTDRWKRYQFHQLAAFFPRVRVVPGAQGDRPNFQVLGQDRARPMGRRNPNNPRIGDIEHVAENLKDPATGQPEITPVFFVTGQKLAVGATDAERRGSLAQWMTAPENPWFAKAFVNRVWSELLGEGFYRPVDDLGPDRKCSAPGTLEYLASQFVSHGHDVKWLYRTILQTEAYQRESRPRRNAEQVPFTANCPQRLRSDQAFDVLLHALGSDQVQQMADQAARQAGPARLLGGPRARFAQIFGFDPSEPREDANGSIPQALFLMNSPLVNRAVDSPRGRGWLPELVAATLDDRQVIEEIYLRCLAREPREAELAACTQYVAESTDRGAACEDVLWSLINGAEFLHRQ